MKVKEPKIVYSVRVLLKRKGKILLLERTKSKGGFSLPGGNVEADEKPLQAIKRESQEEVGIKISKKHLQLVLTLQRKLKKKNTFEVVYFFETSKWKGNLAVHEPHKFSAVRWVDEKELPQNLSASLKLGIQAIHSGEESAYLQRAKQEKRTR